MISNQDNIKVTTWVKREARGMDCPEVYTFVDALIPFLDSISEPKPVGRPMVSVKVNRKKLRKLRKEKGFVQKDIACYLGYTESRVTQFETGSGVGRGVPLDALMMIADLLGVYWKDLLVEGSE